MDSRTAVLAAVLAIAVPGVAHAQTRTDIRAAKDLFKKGKKLYTDGKYAEAAAAFKEAYELSERSELLFNIGQSYRLAGKLRDAETYLQQYLAAAPEADNADEVVETIVEIQQQIAAELATVQVDTQVPGREVYVDAETEPRCTTPCSVTVSPGPRRLTLKGENAADLVEEITLEPGKTFQLKTQLQPAVAKGSLMVSTDRPAGKLAVGEVTEGLPLQRPLELDAGDYAVSVESARKARWSGQVTIAPNETTDIFVPMQSLVEARKRGSLRKSLAYGLWGVSVAAAGGGALLGMQARDTFRQLQGDESSRLYVDEGLVGQGQTQQVAANVMFAAATTAAVTGIVLFVWDEFATEKDPTP